MKTQWHFQVVEFMKLSVELEKLSEENWEIFKIIGVTNSHAGVVAKREVMPVDDAGFVSQAKLKKGRK